MPSRITFCNFQSLLALAVYLIFLSPTQAQEETSRFNIYLHGSFFPGGEATLNAEFRFSDRPKVSWHGRAGIGLGAFWLFVGGPGGSGSITMLTGKKNHHFELNMGVFIGKDRFYEPFPIFYLPIIDFGYRYQKPKGGFLFKTKIGVLGPGIGLGYAF